MAPLADLPNLRHLHLKKHGLHFFDGLDALAPPCPLETLVLESYSDYFPGKLFRGETPVLAYMPTLRSLEITHGGAALEGCVAQLPMQTPNLKTFISSSSISLSCLRVIFPMARLRSLTVQLDCPPFEALLPLSKQLTELQLSSTMLVPQDVRF